MASDDASKMKYTSISTSFHQFATIYITIGARPTGHQVKKCYSHTFVDSVGTISGSKLFNLLYMATSFDVNSLWKQNEKSMKTLLETLFTHRFSCTNNSYILHEPDSSFKAIRLKNEARYKSQDHVVTRLYALRTRGSRLSIHPNPCLGTLPS